MLTLNKALSVPVFDSVVAASGGDYSTVQDAIDDGGVNIMIKDGHYTLTDPVIWDNTDAVKNIYGQSRDGVRFHASGLGSTEHLFQPTGTQVTAAGTVNVTNGSSTITGNAGYDFSGVVVGDYFKVGAINLQDYTLYKIQAKSATTLTLWHEFQGTTATNIAFEVVKPVEGLTMKNLTWDRTTYIGSPMYFISNIYTTGTTLDNIRVDRQGGLKAFKFLRSSDFKVTNCIGDGDDGNAGRFLRLENECSRFCVARNTGKRANFDFPISTISFGVVEQNNMFEGLSPTLFGYKSVFTSNIFTNASITFRAHQSVFSENIIDTGYVNCLSNDARYSRLENNTIVNSPGRGIQTDTNSIQVSVLGNTVVNAANEGIWYRGAKGLITGNQVISCGGDGISVGTDNLVTGNYSNANTGYGINATGNYNHVTGNSCLINTVAGLNDTLGTGDFYGNKTALLSAVPRVETLTAGIGTTNSGTAFDPIIDLDSSYADGVQKLATVGSIDGTSTGATTLYTVPSGKTLVSAWVEVRVTAANTVTVDCAAGVGINGTFDDIFASETLTQIRAVDDIWVFQAVGKSVAGSASEVVKFDIDTGATATTLTLEVTLHGRLI